MNEYNYPPENQQNYYNPDDYSLERNGFVTFWLWLGIISNVAVLLFSLNDGDFLSNGIFTAGLILSVGIAIVGLAMLLNWRKMGFWLVVIGNLISVATVIYLQFEVSELYRSIGMEGGIDTASLIKTIGQSIVSLGILYGVLQIKKNGISCWSQLE